MKNSAKVGLTIALFSILGTGNLIKAVHATQIPNLVEAVKPVSIKAIVPSHQNKQEKEDSDHDNGGETNDDGQK